MSEKADFEIIKQSMLGGELDNDECQQLAGIMGVKHLKDGELLVPEGGTDNTLFLLADGNLTVSNKLEGHDNMVYTMKKGECAGTRAFIDNAPRQATLRASGHAVIYSLTPTDFESLLDKHPKAVYKIMRAIFRITHSNLMRMNMESQEMAKYITKSGGRY